MDKEHPLATLPLLNAPTMKHLLLLITWLSFTTLTTMAFFLTESSISGTVKDDKGEPLIGATITVYKSSLGTVTDVNGHYQLKLPSGTYQIECSYVGFTTKRITDIQVEAGKEHQLDIVLESAATNLDEVVVTGYSRAQNEDSRKYDDMKTLPAGSGAPVEGRSTLKAKSGKTRSAPTSAKPAAAVTEDAAPYREKKAPAKAHLGESRPVVKDAGPVEIKGARSESTKERVGADVRLEERPASLEFEALSSKAETDKSTVLPPDGPKVSPAPRAGLLTAGEWNDLHNWNKHWLDLLGDGEIDEYQKTYGFYPKYRYTVLLSNDHDFPIADAPVQLVGTDGTLYWSAKTDNTGKAELWAQLFDPKALKGKLKIEARVNGLVYTIDTPKEAKDGINRQQFNTECKAPKNVDIVWAVDATGSMGDEIEYLKTELLDVIGRSKAQNPTLDFRMGTVFYRDQGDEYLTKSSGLSRDIAKTVEFIGKQYAGGGGDYPEAVHSALEEAIFNQKWSENAIARICFLVLDASPHKDPAVLASLQNSIREAAKRGIRIVPVTASGIQKDTEFLMKFFGLATNGTYVFLTDHSGIGGSHIEPTTDEYKVELLNDLLVRVITEYTTLKTCEGQSTIRFEDPQAPDPTVVLEARYFPNPAVQQFTLELPTEVQSVTLYDAEGKSVRKLENLMAGTHTIPVQDLPEGFYTIRILKNGQFQSGKLLVVRT
jgi:hypothetical protein